MDLPGYFEFGCRVKVSAGHDELGRIPEALKRLNASHPMIITDKGVLGAGLIDIVTAAMGDRIDLGPVESDVPPDSEVRVVNDLARIYRENNCDAIIAVGGGSVMDTAKGVNIVVSENAEDLMDFSGSGRLKRPLKPLIAIPTTAGTGSEVTQAAVIADHGRNLKMVFNSYFMLPDVAVLDPRMTLTLPPAITAATGMDALTHAVEAYTCLAKNPLSDTSALVAIELVSKNVLAVTRNPGDVQGRLALANGATIAGISFSNSLCGMVHGLGHSVGAVCGVHHGMCMGIGLPYGLEYNLHKNGHMTAELLLPLAGADVYARTPAKDRAEKAIGWIRQLNNDLYAATDGKYARCFKEVTDRDGKPMVPWDKLPAIARTCMGDGTILYNPEEVDYDDALMVLEAAWEGVPLDRSRIKKG
ncbi:MAG: iron-containing alcohol dehydrogenase [Desulfobacterales bacterium]|nr:iron-containing alcohol dehydrogenase [Desulfobacterales bacterium]